MRIKICTKSGKILRLCGTLITLAVALCMPDPAAADWLLDTSTGPYWHQAEAANRTVDQFLGRPTSSDGAADGSGGDGLDRRVDTQGPLRLTQHGSVALVWRHRHSLGEHLDLTTRARLAYGRTRWFLPEGIGILRDPLRVSNDVLSVSPVLGIDRHVAPGAGWRLTLGAGLGAEALYSRTRFSSALVAVRRAEWFRDGFAYLWVGVEHTRLPRDRLTLEVQRRRSIGTHLRLGVSHRF